MENTNLDYAKVCRYPNAKIMYQGNNVVDFWSVSKNGINFSYKTDTSTGGHYGGFSDCQLILRTRDEITDNETLLLYNSLPMSQKHHDDVDKIKAMRFVINGEAGRIGISTAQSIIDYIRSINVSTEPANTEGTYWVKQNQKIAE